MARARNIKPGFFKNYMLADLGPCCQILFAGLWCLADREGRLEDKPRLIKAELFPYYDFDVNGGLTELARCNFVKRYVVNGESFIQVLNFKKHQSPHGTERASVIPECGADESQNHCSAIIPVVHGCITVDSPNNNGGNRPDSLIHRFTDSPIPDSPIAVEAGCAHAPAAEPADAYLKRITTDSNARQPVTMTLDWKPSEQFKTLMMRAGLKPDTLTDAILAKFQIHYNGESKPQNKWESALVTWCKREKPEPAIIHPEQNPDFDYPLHVSGPKSESAADPEEARRHLDNLRGILGSREEEFR